MRPASKVTEVLSSVPCSTIPPASVKAPTVCCTPPKRNVPPLTHNALPVPIPPLTANCSVPPLTVVVPE